ncbi:MAG: hypothetical protein MK008_13545, partial [Bdellovibrionales bacterium]|nr:hypothetical protein [Bdellovibrionales bacterium]
VVYINITIYAFAALKSDGSVGTWCNSTRGGDSSAVSSDLSSNVQKIYSARSAFAALKTDGSVVTWGDSSDGGDSSAVSADLSSDVVDIYNTAYAFAALKNDGQVVAWGREQYGGDPNYQGGIETMGSNTYGVNTNAVDISSSVVKVLSNSGSFIAIKSNGRSFIWGADAVSFSDSQINNYFNGNIKEIYGSISIIYNDGSAITFDGMQNHAPDLRGY